MRLRMTFAATLAALATVSSALAQNVPPLDALAACHQTDGTVKLSFAVRGSECWEVLEPEVTSGYAADLGRVMFPTRATAEVCTMMLKAIPVEASIPTDPAFAELAVVVLGPDGNHVAIGNTAIARSCEGG